MTTIIGLKAEKGKKSTRGVILGSDYTITSTIPEDRGNVIYKRQVTNPFGKLYNGKGDRFVAGFTGVIDNTSIPFIKDLLDGKFDLEKAIAEGKFPEIRDMNLSRWGWKRPTNEQTEMLLAYRFNDRVGLYEVTCLGGVEESSGSVIGSGSEYAKARIETDLRETGNFNMNLTTNYAIDLINMGLKASDQDIYSKGFDMKIVRTDGVLSFGREIKRRTDETRKGLIKHIKGAAKK